MPVVILSQREYSYPGARQLVAYARYADAGASLQ